MPHVYTARVTVRHDELDRFGRLQPAAYLRYLAHAAVEASAAAGYDAGWYAAAGTAWLVRRSTFALDKPAGGGDVLTIRTWVEDFRRVRSHRRYEAWLGDDRCLTARTDWVYVDVASGRPRRVPNEMEISFGLEPGTTHEREPFAAPAPPATPAHAAHRVCMSEIDGYGHVNNAAYLEIAGQAVLDALEDAGWSFDRMLGSGSVPVLVAADLEYLGGALYGDRLDVATWFSPAPGALDAHQRITRAGDDAVLVQSATRWRWTETASGTATDLPDPVLSALQPVLAA